MFKTIFRRTSVVYLLTMFSFFIFSLFSVFILEFSSRSLQSLKTISWMYQHVTLVLASTLLLFCLLVLVYALLNNVLLTLGIGLLFTLLTSLIGYYKLLMLKQPIYPWDVSFFKNSDDMFSILRDLVSWKIIVGSIFIISFLVISLKFPIAKMRWRSRLSTVLFSLLFLFLFSFFFNNQPSALQKKIGFSEITWNQNSNYQMNGSILAFYGNMKKSMMNKPVEYTQEHVLAIAEKYSSLVKKENSETADAQTPNIVYMMDEALFDPTRLNDITYSEDPLVNWHALSKTSPSGYLLSPSFGGNTANTEFESLTGLSNYFLTQGSIPYQQSLTSKTFIPSIATILKSQGYQTMAIHPYHKTLFNRNIIYPILSLDTFYSEEEMKHKERKETYISDVSAVNEVLDHLHEDTGPQFIHLVTMQNHSPYHTGKFGETTIEVFGIDAYATEKKQLETYIQGVKYTDDAVQLLSEGLKTVERPTIVVMFGDHLPSLYPLLFKKVGWTNKPILLHQTPLMFLSNMDIPYQDMGSISPAFIGPTLFTMLGKHLNPYYELLAAVQAQIPGLNSFTLDENTLNASQKQILDDYRLIQYDLLVGKQYSKSILFDQ